MRNLCYLFQKFAELVEEESVGEEEGGGKGEDGSGDTANRHVEHEGEGVDGCQTAEQDAAEQERHGGQAQHGEVGDSG